MKKQTYRCENGKYKKLQKRLIDDDMSFQGFVDWCVNQYLKGNYNPKEEMKMLREKMINEMIDNSVIVNADWLRKNDSEMLEWVTSSQCWGRGFDRNISEDEAVVRVEFDEEGIRIYATFESHPEGVRQSLNNQPPWGEDSWEDWGDPEQLTAYYNEMKK